MISLDHFILRFLLLGLAAGLLTGLYLAGRYWKPRWFDGRLRKLIWLSILFLPLLAVPWPLPFLIPADTPDWVLAARLPDPKIIFPGTDLIEKTNYSFRREPMIRPSSRTAEPDQNGQGSEPESLRQQKFLQTQITPWFWLLDHLAVIRLIFLVGLAMNVTIRLISQPGWRRRRNRQGRAAPPPITNVLWLRDLAAVRDRCGDYRRGTLVAMEPPAASWLAIWRCRRRRWLPITAAELACESPNQRQNSILTALDLSRHPDLLMLFLYSCWRYLAWFTPLAWLPASFFRQDQLLWHQEDLQRQIRRRRRCRTRTDQQPDPVLRSGHVPPGRRGRGQAGLWIARLMTGLIILILVCLALLQNPIRLTPDMGKAWFYQQQHIQPFGLVIEGHAEADTGRAAASQYGIMAGPGQLIGYLDESDSKAAVSGVVAIGDQGGVRWRLPLSTTIDLDLAGSDNSGLQAPVQFSLSDYQELPDGGYTILGRIDMAAVDAMPLVIARITAEGQLTDWQLLDDDTGDLAQTYWISGMTHKLLANGDVLVVDSNVLENPAALASYEMVSTLAATYTLRRLSAQGEAVASFSPDPDTLKTMNLGFWSRGAISGYRRIARIIAAPDGGFYLVIESALILMQIGDTPTAFYQHDGYYQLFNGNDQVARFSAEGKLLWLRELGEREMIVAVNQAVAGADGCLYLAATARYRRLQFMLPADNQLDSLSRNQRIPDMSGPFYPYREAYQKAALYALAPDGRLLWQKELYGEHGAQATQIVLQDQGLSLLVDHDPYMGLAVQLLPRGLSCQSIWQYDLAGHLTAYAPLPKADDYLEQPWFFVRPGFALLPDQPG